jgi:hypothetical protein
MPARGEVLHVPESGMVLEMLDASPRRVRAVRLLPERIVRERKLEHEGAAGEIAG